jgi:hypothetical protein
MERSRPPHLQPQPQSRPQPESQSQSYKEKEYPPGPTFSAIEYKIAHFERALKGE